MPDEPQSERARKRVIANEYQSLLDIGRTQDKASGDVATNHKITPAEVKTIADEITAADQEQATKGKSKRA